MSNDFSDLFPDWRSDDEDRARLPDERAELENLAPRALNEKEVRVVNVYEGIVEDPALGSGPQKTTFVLLRDNAGREFRIFVGRDVAYAISMALDNDVPDRPFTHDLVKNMLDRLGATVERVTIDDLWQDTFYAKITLARGAEHIEMDSRPSDALAIGLRFHAPIYAAESVLDAAQMDE